MPSAAIATAVAGLQDRAGQMFEALRAGSVDAARGGVTRDTYGPGEHFAHRLMAGFATEQGLEIRQDSLLNTYMTWPGHDRAAPALLVGSHLDSVPGGGNFDGAAGVVAGLIAIEALSRASVRLACDLTVMGIRAEESMWFQHSYIGSRGALGLLKPEALANRRIDTGRSLEDHLREAGGDPQAVREGRPFLERERIEAFLEVHIEQAPSLAESGHAIAICQAIPGNFRHARARIIGEYGHVGLPRRFRRDAALAGADLFMRLDQLWAQWDTAGRPMALTIGEFHTDAARHGLTIVPGEFHFSLDVRAYRQSDLAELEAFFHAIVREVEASRGVRIELGPRAAAPAAPADPLISAQLAECAHALGLDAPPLLSPASHDSAAFCAAGVPYGFVFIRNPNGSHHAEERMDLEDFMQATAVLAEYLASRHAHA
jgi:N-carbamoyl-L-amino-acid hydrolase